MGRRAIKAFLVLLAAAALAGNAWADTAEVLPKGVARARIDYYHSFPIKERYNEKGNKESLADDFNTDLNSSVFDILALFDPVTIGLGLGPASLGRSVVSFQYDIRYIEMFFMYGLTDKLSIGAMFPYWWVKADVKTSLDTTNANLGKNANFPFTSPDPIVPAGAPGYTPFTVDDIQNILGNGLVVNGVPVLEGFGYKPVQNWSNNDFADIEVGARYQYYKSENWRLSFTGGARLPTGTKDDPDNLVDYALSEDCYSLLFRMENDYIGIKNLTLNATLKYDLSLPSKMDKRVPDNIDVPVTPNKERVDVNTGDWFWTDLAAYYDIVPAVRASFMYRFSTKPKDKVSGNMGFNYTTLEDRTDMTEHLYFVGLSYSTLPMFLNKKFPVPLTASVTYKNRFAGKNMLASDYLVFGLDVYF